MLLSAGPALVVGQEPTPGPGAAQPTDPYEGRFIRELRLVKRDADDPSKIVPLADGIAQLIRNQIRSSQGLPYSREAVKEDITRLNRLGRFRTIDSTVQLLADGSVALTYTVVEQALIQDVQVVGNREISDQDILKEVGVLAGTPIDRFQIDRAARAIEDVYRTKGFYQARVEVDEKTLAESAIVVFRIIEGQPVRVTQIRFDGNNAFAAKELRSQITTTTFKPILDKAPLDDEVLTKDKAALVRFYRDRGYLDARADARIQPSPDGKEAAITFYLDEGPLYTLRSVRVLYQTEEALRQYKAEVLKDEAAKLTYLTPEQMRAIGRRPFSDEQISGLMLIKPGDVYSDDKIRKSLDAIRAAYGKLGYLLDTPRGPDTVRIDPQPVRDEKKPEVDLFLFLQEGKPTITGEIKVTGNDLTKQQVILREVQVKPGRPLDAEALEESQRRIDRLRLFQPGSVKLTILPEDRLNPGVRDPLFEVAETNTGRFILGAAVSSDGGVVGTVEVRQENFDIADFPDSWSELFSGRAFRGAGQTSDLSIQPGTQFSNYSYTLTDPHLLETDYSGSAGVFYKSSDLRVYTEEEVGTRLRLGRRFGSVWEGYVQARIEGINLGHLEDDRPVDAFAVQDEHILTSLGIDLIRNTTDNRLRPSRGGRLELGVDQAGALGGDFDFTHLRYGYTAFFPVYESFLGYKTIVKLENRIDYIPQGQDATPIYERLYLGGQSFRGFAHRAVSPIGIRNDTHTRGDDPVGGSFLFALGAEINQPIYKDIFSVVGFVDTGTVQEHFGFSDYRVSVGFGIRFYIRQLSPVPIAFDFGFPILRQETDRQRVLTFSLDVPYQ